MAETKHFRLSPSGAYRWLVCPGSLQHDGESKSSSYADEGTKAHDMAAAILKTNLAGNIRTDFPPGEMRDAANVFVAFCAPLAAAAMGYAIEETIESTTIPNFGGTADFRAVSFPGQDKPGGPIDQTCDIVDFKYGAGVPVAAERNPQLLCYAMLVAERHRDVSRFRLTIIQPRTPGDAVDTWECSRAEVDAFAERVKAAAGQSHYDAGDHCRWCPVLASCDHLASKAIELARDDFAIEPAAERWPLIMKLAPAIEKLLATIPGKMLDAMRKGHVFAGWKAVQARAGNRQWRDDEAATLKALKKAGIGKRAACATVLKSPAQLERDGHGDAVAALVTRAPGGVTLAPATDKRPAVVFETPEESFSDLSFLA